MTTLTSEPSWIPTEDRLHDLESVYLAKVKRVVATHLGPSVASTLDVSLERTLVGTLAVRLTAEVLTDQLPPKTVEQTRVVEFETPATWWQHWKLDHATSWYAGWLVRRRPVRMRRENRALTLSVNLERFRHYPQSTVVVPEDQLGVAVLGHRVTPSLSVGMTGDRDSKHWDSKGRWS